MQWYRGQAGLSSLWTLTCLEQSLLPVGCRRHPTSPRELTRQRRKMRRYAGGVQSSGVAKGPKGKTTMSLRKEKRKAERLQKKAKVRRASCGRRAVSVCVEAGGLSEGEGE